MVMVVTLWSMKRLKKPDWFPAGKQGGRLWMSRSRTVVLLAGVFSPLTFQQMMLKSTDKNGSRRREERRGEDLDPDN